MIDQEVETALREIRERVVSQPLPAARTAPAIADQSDRHPPALVTPSRSNGAMTRLNAHLTTTARAWDRLPPVFSNRTGNAARVELWIKARLKRISRWFTWEQVNFNAAVHHALGETVQALAEVYEVLREKNEATAALQARCAQLDSRLQQAETQNAALRAELEIHRDDIHSLRAQLQADIAANHIGLQNQQREINSLRGEARGELEALRIKISDLDNELRQTIDGGHRDTASRLNELAAELRERSAVLEDEQRVCYKQLSLEVNEIAAAMEHARRSANTQLQELNGKVRSQQQTKTHASKS